MDNWHFLEDHGWTIDGDYAKRDGTDKPVSASFVVAKDGTPLLHVFSSSAEPFEMNKNYSRETAYAMLNHEGSVAAARAALGVKKRRFQPISSQELDATDCEPEYLIDNTLVAASRV